MDTCSCQSPVNCHSAGHGYVYVYTASFSEACCDVSCRLKALYGVSHQHVHAWSELIHDCFRPMNRKLSVIKYTIVGCRIMCASCVDAARGDVSPCTIRVKYDTTFRISHYMYIPTQLYGFKLTTVLV